jgi:hypothetical protein
MQQIYLRYRLICNVLAILFLTSCNDEVYPIPNVPVNININLDLPAYNALNSPGGFAYANGGSRGLVIYRDFDKFVALDRHSTYESEKECAIVHVDPDNIFELVDTCSGSRFSIVSGVVIQGPAKFGLKQYNTYWDGAYTVNVFN